MSKNFKNIYNSSNDAIALEQKFFLVEESVRGTPVPPTGAAFIKTLSGGAITYSRGFEPSPIRSGRHNSTGIQKKDVTSWAFPTYFMVDSAAGSFATTEIDPAMRTLLKSALGTETVGGSSLAYAPADAPNTTFTLLMNGDQFASQAVGAFVESANLQFPGDGEATTQWAGSAKTMYRAGIAKSTTANAAHVVTVGTGEGARFEVGALVMIIKTDGVTRSSDTPDGSPRTITAIAGDAITLSGTVLADADGSVSLTPVYLCYYEPTTPVALNDPLTGLVGTITIGTLSQTCIRSFGLNLVNNHELHNFCWGQRGLSGSLFTPGGRLNAECTYELNMNAAVLEFITGLKAFGGHDITLVLGPAGGRRMEITLPKVITGIPDISIPDAGSIPVTFTGMAYETAEDAADEVTISFK